MSLRSSCARDLRLPVFAAPMFIVSGRELVLAQRKDDIVGSFPALNARPEAMPEIWLASISKELNDHKVLHPNADVAPNAVNQIAHSSNVRLQHDQARAASRCAAGCGDRRAAGCGIRRRGEFDV
jgi:nitronate monooxygenase